MRETRPLGGVLPRHRHRRDRCADVDQHRVAGGRVRVGERIGREQRLGATVGCHEAADGIGVVEARHAARVGDRLEVRGEAANVMAAPQREADDTEPSHPLERDGHRLFHQPVAGRYAAVPDGGRAGVADDLVGPGGRHVALGDTVEVERQHRHAVRPVAHRVGQRQEPRDAGGLVRLQPRGGDQRLRKRRQAGDRSGLGHAVLLGGWGGGGAGQNDPDLRPDGVVDRDALRAVLAPHRPRSRRINTGCASSTRSEACRSATTWLTAVRQETLAGDLRGVDGDQHLRQRVLVGAELAGAVGQLPPDSAVATRSSRIDSDEPFQNPIGSTRQVLAISTGSVDRLPSSS